MVTVTTPSAYWGKLPRGRLWHLLRTHTADRVQPTDPTYCDLGKPVKEIVQGQPPMGGDVCERCHREVMDLARAMEVALTTRRAVEGE